MHTDDLAPTAANPTRAPRRRRLPPLACALLTPIVAALGLLGCSEPTPAVEERLLVIDGIEIRFDELAPYIEFLDSFQPEAGRKTKVMHVLTDHVLPLRLAQRAFPQQRAEQFEHAQALCSVAGNVLELEQQSALISDKLRKNMTRVQARLPVAMFLFDPLRTFAVSPPLELPQGWYVVGSYDLQTSPLAMADYVDALQVGFITHTAKEWLDWYDAEQQRVGDKVTFVHPDYRDDMPSWIRLPKKP